MIVGYILRNNVLKLKTNVTTSQKEFKIIPLNEDVLYSLCDLGYLRINMVQEILEKYTAVITAY